MVKREETNVPSDHRMNLYVRVLSDEGSKDSGAKPPMLLIHGARVSSVPSFDLEGIANGSLAADLVDEIGCKIFLMDVRGYGNSTRPKEMNQIPELNPPLVRSSEAARDIGAVIDSIIQREGCRALYGVIKDHPSFGHGSSLEDPENKGQFNRKSFGAYSFNTKEALLGVWDRSIPTDDKSEWRDPQIAEVGCFPNLLAGFDFKIRERFLVNTWFTLEK